MQNDRITSLSSKTYLIIQHKKGGNQRNDKKMLRFHHVRFIFYESFNSYFGIFIAHYLIKIDKKAKKSIDS